MFNLLKGSKEIEPASDMSREEYARVLQNVSDFVECFDETEGKISALEYVLAVFRAEYVARTRSRLFRCDETTTIDGRFPHEYRIADGTSHKITDLGQKEITLDSHIAVSAWRLDRLSAILPVIQNEGFIEHTDNHYAVYYPYIDLTVVSNGNHSISAGVFLKSGSIHAHAYDLTDLFAHVDTDGERWIDSYVAAPFAPVGDRYFALLYSIAQMKYSYEHAK